MSTRFVRVLAGTAIVIETFAALIPVGSAGGGLYPSPSSQPSVFLDVSDSSINSDAIRSLKDSKVIQGYGDGSFKPDQKINRAEFTKIVVESLGRPFEKKTNCFPDVREEWFSTYVCAAKAEGWIGGYPDGTFRPADNISFVEAAKIVAYAYGSGLIGISEPWYQFPTEWLQAKKAIPLSITGFPQAITRAEMAEIIYRIKSNITTHASRTYEELKGEGTISGQTCQQLFERMQLPQIPTTMGTVVTPTEAAVPQGDMGGGKGGGGGYTPGSPFTSTNVQVPGVDEGDIVKTDGDYIYIAKADTVRIVQAVPPAQLKEIATVKLPLDPNKGESFYVTELYASGNTLVVSGSFNAPIMPVEGQKIVPPWQYNPLNRILVFDTKVKSSPKLLRSVAIQGNGISSRLIGNTLYSVNALWSYGPYALNSSAASSSGSVLPLGPQDFTVMQGVVQGANVLRVKAQQQDVIPTITDSKDGVTRPLVDCKDVLLFPKIPSTNYVSVSAIPLSDLTKPVASTMMVADSNASYVSAKNMYLTSTDWSQVRGDLRSSETTTLYKFALGNTGAAFVAKGSVPGSVLNQWSMDEYQDHLRVATTKHPSIGPRQYSAANVYVLDGQMTLVGQTKDLAPNEQAYAILFMGSKGIVATYRQVDPLFALDLSNPKNPQVKGALKIPGQPQYALEWDNTHVITFGNDDANWTTDVPPPNTGGVKVALYDVSDLSNPKEVQHVVIGQSGSSTDASYNSKAVMVDRERGLLAFPVTESAWTTQTTQPQDKCATYSYDQCPINNCQKTCVPSSCTTENGVQVCTPDCSGAGSCKSWNYVPDPTTGGTFQTVWQGAYVYDVAPTGLTLKGKVTNFTDADKDPVNGQMQWWGNKAIQRILRIGDTLYTVSLGMVKALSLPVLTEVKSTVIVGD